MLYLFLYYIILQKRFVCDIIVLWIFLTVRGVEMGTELVMKSQAEKIGDYIKLTREIDKLESGLAGKENELKSKYLNDYNKLYRELGGYISKIKPTVETVCSLYRGKVQLSNNRIYLQDGALAHRYTALDACETAIKLGNEGIKILSAIIGRVNVDANLREFAIRYNTIVDIYSKANNLQAQAVSMSMDSYKNEIAELKLKRQGLFKNSSEFASVVNQVKEKSNQLYAKAIINDKLTLQNSFVTEISLPLGYESCDAKSLGISDGSGIILSLLDWNLHNDGIMVIKSENESIDSTELSSCLVNTAIQFLFSYPSTSKKVLLCDSSSSNTITTFAGILKNGNPELFFDNASGSFVKNSDEEIRTSLSELNRIINQRIMVLGQSRCADTLEYNKKNQDNPLPIILAVLNGYPTKYEHAMDDIVSMLKNGKDAGVFFLITENIYEDEDSKYYRKKLPNLDAYTKNIVDFKLFNGRGYLSKDGKSYLSNTCGKNYSISSIVSVFKVSVKSSADKIVYLDSVVDKEDFKTSSRRTKYSTTLSIPFGKQGSNPVSIDLDARGSEAHLAVIGTTGSGKTAFINTLVLSACKLYSPEELEIHLILMVKEDFKVFKEQGLPHLKTLVTGNNIFAANDVLDFLQEEMDRRGNLIGSYGNIYAYNEAAQKKLPRCVVVIDEFYQLVAGSDDAVKRIEKIAQTGRAYGISLVVSSIKFPIEINSIIPMFGNRVEFKAEENAGQLIPEVANRQSELDKKGLCFFSHKRNLQNVRVAFSEEGEKLNAHISEIKYKYPSRKMELQSEISAVKVSRESDAPFTAKNAKLKYDEEGVVRTRLGMTYLSNKPLEYTFESKNNVLFLFGHYLETKKIEASLIKDILVLSKDIEEPTAYHIDLNRNASLKRKSTIMRVLKDKWADSNKVVFETAENAEETLNEIKELIETRQNDEEADIYPVLVVITRAESLFEDDDMIEELCHMFDGGKENNVYFVLQCDEPIDTYGFNRDKYMTDAIILPDRQLSDNDYSSTALINALDKLPAGTTDKGKKLISDASSVPLDPQMHLLCDNNKISLFIPYEYDENYLKNIVD